MRAESIARTKSDRASAAPIDYGRVGLISAGHLLSDLYSNLLTALMPYLVLEGRISTTLAGLILLVYLSGSSILQPIFGVLADQSGRRLFAVAGPLWVGVGACLAGWAPNVVALVLLAGVSSIGSAAFHPQAASMVNGLSVSRKGWAMSLFSMGGNVGFAVGPVLAAAIAVVGLHWGPIFLLPGFALTLFLARYAPSAPPSSAKLRGADMWKLVRRAGHGLSLIVAVIALRSGAQYALIIFLPLYYHAQGSSAELGSFYAFVLSLAGAAGGMLGGSASDRYGRKIVVVLSLLISAPLLTLTLTSSDIAIWFLLALSGAALLAGNSVTVVQGQELLPANTGIASGLTMGLAFGLSGVIAAALTTLSDHIGVRGAILLVPLLPLSAAILAALVPRPRVLRV
jgi:FSR family fosmidomycin resistance protein-like MFS transporter